MNRILILCISLLFAIKTYAQEKDGYHNSIGLSLGLPAGINFKSFIGSKSAIDLVGGIRLGSDFSDQWFTAIYQCHQNLKTEGVRLYYGGGFTALHSKLGGSSFGLGLNANIGIEYKFPDAPFVFAADWSPLYWLRGHTDGIDLQSGAVKVRYVIN